MYCWENKSLRANSFSCKSNLDWEYLVQQNATGLLETTQTESLQQDWFLLERAIADWSTECSKKGIYKKWSNIRRGWFYSREEGKREQRSWLNGWSNHWSSTESQKYWQSKQNWFWNSADDHLVDLKCTQWPPWV